MFECASLRVIFVASKIELAELVNLLNFLVQGVDSVLEHLIVAI